jgi:glutamate mutase epsilon subunit
MTPNPREEGINERMKRLLAMPHCPQCGLLPREHDNYTCDMRYEENEVCVLTA